MAPHRGTTRLAARPGPWRLAPWALALALSVPHPALATNGMRLIGLGPVQNAMGGVGVGATLDAASLFTNPAGLADLDRQLELAATWFKPTVSYRASESQLPPGLGGAVVARPDATIDSRRGGNLIPFIAAVLPVSDRLKLGLGLTGVSGMGVDYPANLYGGATYTSYLQARLAPAIAYRVGDLVAVGLTVNVLAAQMKYDVARGFGQQPHDTATSLGIGATLGVKFKPARRWDIGLAYETKSRFQDFKFHIPAHTGVDPATFQPVDLPAGTDRLTFDQPQIVSVGTSVTPVAWVVLAADAQWINWSDTNGRNRPAYRSPVTTGALPWDLSWSDQWVLKLGLQATPLPSLRVRAGWNYGKSPLDRTRAFENIAFPAIAEHHLTAGLGLDLTRALTLDVAAGYAPKVTIAGANAAYPAQGGQAIASYSTSMSQYTIDAGVTWRL
jgi:long-chain fatty acid transport protein